MTTSKMPFARVGVARQNGLELPQPPTQKIEDLTGDARRPLRTKTRHWLAQAGQHCALCLQLVSLSCWTIVAGHPRAAG